VTDLTKLKDLIDEDNFPYFEDEYLLNRIDQLDADEDLYDLARELCIVKSGIGEIKLGDITIPSPKEHFLTLADRLRKNVSRAVGRADEY